MGSLLWLINSVISIYTFIVIGQVVVSWLIAFRVINMQNQFVHSVAQVLHQLTEPALRPIRKIVPTLGGLDFSPVILLLALMFVQRLINELFFQTLMYRF